MFDRFRIFRLAGERITEVVLGILIIGFNFDRPSVILHRFINLPLPGKKESKIVVSKVIILCDLNGVAEKRLAVLPIFQLKVRESGASKYCEGAQGEKR